MRKRVHVELPDSHLITCHSCGGTGGSLIQVWPQPSWWATCFTCGGRGTVGTEPAK